MENNTSSDSSVYSAEGIGVILAATAAAIGAIVYSAKNIKHVQSGCCECTQKIDDQIIIQPVANKMNISNV